MAPKWAWSSNGRNRCSCWCSRSYERATQCVGVRSDQDNFLFQLGWFPVEYFQCLDCSSSSHWYDESRVVYCPQLPPAQTKPTVVQGTPSNWTLAVSISDGATFTVQTILTVTSDGNLYTDSIGNRFILPIAASGSRTYYSLAGGVASVTGMSAIRGLLPIGNVTTSSNNLGVTTSTRTESIPSLLRIWTRLVSRSL